MAFQLSEIVWTLRKFKIKIKYYVCHKALFNCFSLKIILNSASSLISHSFVYLFIEVYLYLLHISLSYSYLFVSFPSSHTFQLNYNLLKVKTWCTLLVLLSTSHKVQGHYLCSVNVDWMSSVTESNKWIFFYHKCTISPEIHRAHILCYELILEWLDAFYWLMSAMW